ncbi:LamG-like jellyroll fold domain-containing protein [Cobetia marina]|uniref:LamG-like jellyroll fold domain-containing protein n=1 Tax=Cobetia marina TaxID=28258 RepID=UPI0008656B21|nr:LamG-like jellyroll fold domain-containing protein [Cobetia marina]AOM00875.1 hypothetical protein BFX80_05645 [Cobetia marina]
MSYQSAVLADSPADYLVMDSAGNIENLGASPSAVEAIDPNPVFSPQAYKRAREYTHVTGFNGDAYAVLQLSDHIVAGGSFTCEFFLANQSNEVAPTISINKPDKGGYQFLIGFTTAFANHVYYNGGGPSGSRADYVFGGDYDHIALLVDRDNESVSYIINGSLRPDLELSVAGLDIAMSTEMYIGAYSSSGTVKGVRGSGRIESFAVYNRLITEEEVANHLASDVAERAQRELVTGGAGISALISGPISNPLSIGASGRSSVVAIPRRGLMVHVDQLDGSGGNGTATGGVSDPARMGVIAGTVLDIHAQPISRRVRVHDRITGRIVREAWSGADGKYRFTDLDPRRAFYVMAFDYTLQQNAVVSDNVHSEVEDSP